MLSDVNCKNKRESTAWKKSRKMAVAAVQIMHPEPFNFSNSGDYPRWIRELSYSINIECETWGIADQLLVICNLRQDRQCLCAITAGRDTENKVLIKLQTLRLTLNEKCEYANSSWVTIFQQKDWRQIQARSVLSYTCQYQTALQIRSKYWEWQTTSLNSYPS